MSLPALSAVVATAARSAAPPATDGELLRRFVHAREEDAFAALVGRLGPMVLGVCRRVARDGHLAEDAFQAAFVVLACRATEVRPAEAGGATRGPAANWKASLRGGRGRVREPGPDP